MKAAIIFTEYSTHEYWAIDTHYEGIHHLLIMHVGPSSKSILPRLPLLSLSYHRPTYTGQTYIEQTTQDKHIANNTRAQIDSSTQHMDEALHNTPHCLRERAESRSRPISLLNREQIFQRLITSTWYRTHQEKINCNSKRFFQRLIVSTWYRTHKDKINCNSNGWLWKNWNPLCTVVMSYPEVKSISSKNA